MAELLFEIGCEEMPARFVKPAIDQLKGLAANELAVQGLLPQKGASLEAEGTPRRLVLMVKGLNPGQSDREEKVLGPPKAAAYDQEGNPTKAALGFAKSKGIELGDLVELSSDKGPRLGFINKIPGRDARSVLQGLLPGLVKALSFARTMRWGSLSFRFARPIHWYLALLDGQVIPFALAGINSGSATRGHRFHAPDPFEVFGIDDYLAKLSTASVVVGRGERRDMVVQEIRAAARQAGGRLVTDEPLIEENTDLVEQAVACCGSFDREFLEVPRPVIISAMRSHQRYFALEDGEGRLLPNFIAVNNTRPRDLAVVTKGHEKVIRARLADARFFLQEDTKRPLIDFLEDLKDVTYHAKLGTSFAKVERFSALAGYLADEIAPEKKGQVLRAAKLAKCDLVTEMVGEFPDLQGVVGAEYARLSGEDPGVAAAVEEHYLPMQSGGALPQSVEGLCVGLADRLDSICGCFGVGLIPTGAADPYGLRRAAIACLRLVIEKGLSLSLYGAMQRALEGLDAWLERDAGETFSEVKTFFHKRFTGLLTEQGVPTDVAEAVLNAGFDDPTATQARALALAAVKDSPDFMPLAVGMKRVMNILRKEADQVPDAAPDPGALTEGAEKELYSAFTALESDAADLFAAADYKGFLARLSALKAPIDKFFDDVLVIEKDETIRHNRLAMLNQIACMFRRIAEFTHLQLA